jgi:broad specificity phosphatase PhoE
MELDDLREVNVGDLDGRSDARAWEIYTRVLAAWRAGDAGARFPGGEDRDELCARLLRALTTVVASSAAAGRVPARGGVAGSSRVPARGGVAGSSRVPARGGVAGRSRVAARGGAAGRSLVVAHGANLRAALPGLTGTDDPGADLPTGGVAALQVVPGVPGAPGALADPPVRLVSWPSHAGGN